MVCLRIPLILMMMMVVNNSLARELRPSDHGLDYQSCPPVGEKMKDFFKSPSSSSMALPRAMNSNDSSSTWWNDVGGGDRLRLRHVLLLGTFVCGAVGAALLAITGFIYFRRYKTQTQNQNQIIICK
ncbi:uncharacterized protein [Euphorbia lathyris]|uniref:uncharacterized protein n=1 Tax=Euphorbia lathyris TaxID=212925 RepID=UPI0033136E90